MDMGKKSKLKRRTPLEIIGPAIKLKLSIDLINNGIKEDGKEREQDLEHTFRNAIHS